MLHRKSNVPLGQYFLSVGSALVALLFLITSYLPQTETRSASQGPADRSILRIQSAHKWPESVIYDTSQPTIVPPPASITGDVLPPPFSENTRGAFAQTTPVKQAVKRSSIVRYKNRGVGHRMLELSRIEARRPLGHPAGEKND